jgi:hypothetical protein
MKKVSFGVALIVSALVIGCQDSSNNPISNPASAISKAKGNVNPDGIIVLKQLVSKDPSVETAEMFDLAGTIQYTLVGADNNYDLSLVVDGSIQSLSNPDMTGKIYSESIDFVMIPEKEAVSYEKTLVIDNFDLGYELHILFMISTTDVQVAGAWLSDPGSFQNAK